MLMPKAVKRRRVKRGMLKMADNAKCKHYREDTDWHYCRKYKLQMDLPFKKCYGLETPKEAKFKPYCEQ